MTWYLEALEHLVPPAEWDIIYRALQDVLSHLVEGRLLSHDDLSHVREMPNVYGSRAATEIRNLLAQQYPPLVLSDGDVANLARALLRRDEPDEITPAALYEVLKQAAHACPPRIRCVICGYAFREQDFAADRRLLLGALQVEFAELHASREFDYYKPHHATAAQVDHKVPRASWGGSGPSNLQLLCEFCNQGKLAFRHALGGLSLFASLSLRLPVRSRANAIGRHHWPALVAALAVAQGCETCGKSPLVTELRAAPRAGAVWSGPWNLRVQCYECFVP